MVSHYYALAPILLFMQVDNTYVSKLVKISVSEVASSKYNIVYRFTIHTPTPLSIDFLVCCPGCLCMLWKV